MFRLLIYFCLLLALDKESTSTPTNNIGFVVPSFSLGTGGLIYSIIFAIECFFFLTFILFPKNSLHGFQTQAVIFQGILIGFDHVLASSTRGFGESLLFYISIISAPIAALLSVNDKFKNLFISLINAYGTTYFLSIIFRLSYLVCIVTGIILYFVYFLTNTKVLSFVLGKIITATLSALAIIDVWGYISLMKALHGDTTSNTSFVISCIVVFLIFVGVSLLVIIPIYFQDWTNKKLAAYQATGTQETSGV